MQSTHQPKASNSIIMRSLPWIAFVAVLASGAMFVHTTLFYLNAKQATCTVLKVDVSQATNTSRNTSRNTTRSTTSTTYRPTIEYTDDQGRNHVVEFAVSAGHYDYNVGQKVAILYDPQDPQAVRFNSFSGVWGLTFCIVILAGIVVGVACYSRIAQRKLHREKAMRENDGFSDDTRHAKDR